MLFSSENEHFHLLKTWLNSLIKSVMKCKTYSLECYATINENEIQNSFIFS